VSEVRTNLVLASNMYMGGTASSIWWVHDATEVREVCLTGSGWSRPHVAGMWLRCGLPPSTGHVGAFQLDLGRRSWGLRERRGRGAEWYACGFGVGMPRCAEAARRQLVGWHSGLVRGFVVGLPILSCKMYLFTGH